MSIGVGIDHHKIKHNKLNFAEKFSWPKKARDLKMEKTGQTFEAFLFFLKKIKNKEIRRVKNGGYRGT